MIRVSILGGSGYGGGELLRLLLDHPHVEVAQVTSRRLAGKHVARAHPNLRGRGSLKFTAPEELGPCDLLFLALPHGHASDTWNELEGLAERFVDLSADFRLDDMAAHARHYGAHARPDVAATFVYGLAEVNRDQVRGATRVAAGGCNASVTLLALAPFFAAGVVDRERSVVEVKVGSSEGGAVPNEGSHHPVRRGVVRPYQAAGHRHTAEVEAMLSRNGGPARVHLSVTAVDMVRGASALAHLFPLAPLSEKDVWGLLRDHWDGEPFIRLVKERSGPYRLPEPKLLAGTNYCDVGFEVDPLSDRLVVVAAIDNLMKGAAGQAVQAMNLMYGWDETAGLGFSGLHPV